MTALREAAQQALEALERGETKLRWAAITALRAALAKPVQEPAYKVKITGRWHDAEPFAAAFSLPDGEHLLYTAPPQRPAEPVQEPVLNPAPGYCKHCKQYTIEEPLTAEPVKESVAKVELMLTGGNAGLATRIVEIDDHLRERLRPGQLLYTAPPQPAEPVQEPEALKDPAEYDDFAAAIRHNERITTWRYDSVGTVALETVYETIIHWDEGGGKRSRRELARRIVDLYAAPPQRKEG